MKDLGDDNDKKEQSRVNKHIFKLGWNNKVGCYLWKIKRCSLSTIQKKKNNVFENWKSWLFKLD